MHSSQPSPKVEVLRFAKKQRIFAQGGKADAVFYIQTGKAKLTAVSMTGQEATIGIFDCDQYVASAGCDEAAVEARRYAAASSEQIVEEKQATLHQQQTKHAEEKANLPRQLTVHKATVDFRKANVDSAKAQLDAALLNLRYCHIVAPVDGIASQRSAEIEGRSSQRQQLIVVVQIGNV